MGLGTLTDRSTGETILDTFFNDVHSALNGDFVGRNTGSGAAETGKNLGTNAIPWGTVYANSMVLNGSAVDTSLLTAPKNRIVSGATRSGSNQPQFITPNGAAASFTVDGATTNLVLDVDGATVTVSTDITKSSLTVGPSTTATALIDDADAADQESTRTWGEIDSEKESITVDTMGAEFQSFIGQYQIISHGSEYFLGYIKSATEISNCFRGYFTNSSGAPLNRDVFSNNDTLTVLSTGWVFVENDGATVDVTYTTPVRSFTAPGSPATGDYWYDLANETWKRYDGATFQIINRTLVAVVGIDSSNCVCARSFDFYAKYETTNEADFDLNSTEIIELKSQGTRVNVAGFSYDFGFNQENWNITTDLAGSADMYNATEQASTTYYAYLKDTGDTVFSDISPYYRPDLLGYYHPHNPWRCLAEAFNDSSNDLDYIFSSKYKMRRKWDLRDNGALTITGTTSDPTKASTATIDNFFWRRDGRYLEGTVSYSQPNATGAAAGSGDYVIELPNSLVMDLEFITAYSTVEGAGGFTTTNVIGYGIGGNQGTNQYPLVAVAHDSTNLRVFISESGNGVWSSAFAPFSIGAVFVFLTIRVPIVGWND